MERCTTSTWHVLMVHLLYSPLPEDLWPIPPPHHLLPPCQKTLQPCLGRIENGFQAWQLIKKRLLFRSGCSYKPARFTMSSLNTDELHNEGISLLSFLFPNWGITSHFLSSNSATLLQQSFATTDPNNPPVTQWSNSNSSLQVRSNVFWERRTRMFSSEISSNTVRFEDFESWYRNHYKRHHPKKKTKIGRMILQLYNLLSNLYLVDFQGATYPPLRILLRFGQNLLDHEWLRKTNAPALEDLAVKHPMFCYLDWITKCCKSWRRIQTQLASVCYKNCSLANQNTNCPVLLSSICSGDLKFSDQH